MMQMFGRIAFEGVRVHGDGKSQMQMSRCVWRLTRLLMTPEHFGCTVHAFDPSPVSVAWSKAQIDHTLTTC